MSDENPVVEAVDKPAEDVPTPVTPEPDAPEHPPHEESHDSDHDDKVIAAVESVGEKIISALNTLKEASPVTPAEEHVLDEVPVKAPWTHRSFGRRK